MLFTCYTWQGKYVMHAFICIVLYNVKMCRRVTLEGDHSLINADAGMRTVDCQELLADKVKYILHLL